ncbi:uncharacterized protein LOC121390491 [Gigantopelta aegis]|uniref:uncharacterized protein LOC121390491 n=1 Tax=Gigantopelta aegis TaxID=1735272 RepID=UPI001B88B16B|nr:uncharacterized protein LOC121390491 [Gigantopelta aegis]
MKGSGLSMASRLVGSVIISTLITLSLSVHVNPNYPFTIESEPATFEGRVCSDAIVHQPIVLMSEEAKQGEDGCTKPNDNFIKLFVKNVTANIIYNGHRRNHGHMRNATNVVLHHRNATNDADLHFLPAGLEFNVVHTNAFDVDDDFLIVVSNNKEFNDKASIHFYVVLVTIPEREVVSNPLPFVVHVDHVAPKARPHGAVIFAGVIALLIIAIVLTIPITVFVKRRRSKGKAICLCGEAASGKVETKPEQPTGNGALKGSINPSMIFDTEIDLKTSASDASLTTGHETIQDHQLRSLSQLHFQPTWLDPHYRDSHHLRLQKSLSNGTRQSITEKF